MDPALQELIEAGPEDSVTPIVVRLRQAGEVPDGLTVVSTFGPIVTARTPIGRIASLRADPRVASIKAPRWLGLEDPSFAHEADTEDLEVMPTDLRRPPQLAQDGHGVIVGVVDWGCDFRHPEFRNADGTTRLLALWDQSSPRYDNNRFGYGRIHDATAIQAALAAADPYAALGYAPSASDPGKGAHGSHVLGIAAGSGLSGGPQGVAPGADLAFVHLAGGSSAREGSLGDSSSLLEALDWLREIADGRPLVVNLSIGRHAGPHDGSSPVEMAIDWLVRSRPGLAVTQSAGNYHDRDIHACGTLRAGERARLAFDVDPADTTPNELDIWLPGRDTYSISLESPGGTHSWTVPLGEKRPLAIGGKRIGTLYHRARDPNGDHQINLFLYTGAPPGKWIATLEGLDVVDGRYHAWVERDPGCRQCQVRFAPGFANPATTTGSVCNGLYSIVVGACDGHSPGRPLAPFSSSGPTRDGRVRPLLLAPGMRVLSARSSSGARVPAALTRMSGTSMAAPHVTGTIALMLEAGGAMPIERVRRLLLDSLDPAQVDAADLSRCGYGYLNTARAVELSLPSLPSPSADTEASMTCPCQTSENFPATESAFPVDANAVPETSEGTFQPEARWHPVEWGESLVLEGESDPQSFLGRFLEGPGAGSSGANGPSGMDLYRMAAQLGRRGLDELSRRFDVVATPGSIVPAILQAGDLLLRRIGGGTHPAVIAHPHLYRAPEAIAQGLALENDQPGFYAMVVEPGARPHVTADHFARRVAGNDRRALDDTVLLRPLPIYRSAARESIVEDDGPSSECRELAGFPFGSEALTAAHRVRIPEIARELLGAGVGRIVVIGYASAEGPAAYNVALGQRRAEAVAGALRTAGMRVTMEVRSEGEGRQVPGGGSANRRVAVCFEHAGAAPRSTAPLPDTRLSCDTVTVWINAFIPLVVPGYSRIVAAGPHAGESVLCVLGRCFATDQRAFNNALTGITQRMRSIAEIRLSPPALLRTAHPSDTTHEIDPATGAVSCTAVARGGVRRFHSFAATAAPGGGAVIRVNVEGGDRNPCITASPDIDYTGTFTVRVMPSTGRVSVDFEGLVDGFPAYEAYARIGGVTQTLFRFGPGGTPYSLMGAANLPVRGHVEFDCAAAARPREAVTA